MRLLSLPTKPLFHIAVAVLLAGVAVADRNDDLYAKGTAAVGSGDAVAARDAFCAVDPSYKDAASQCTLYKGEAQRAINRYNQNFLEGVQLMQEGKLDQAEIKFRNVKAGDRVDLAKRKLVEIQDLRQKNAAAAQAAAAQNSQYENKMAEAARLAAAKDYAGAAAAYAEAANINPNGAGNPAGQAANMRQLAAQANAAAAAPTATPVKKERAKIDEGDYIAQAKRFIGRNDFSRARRFLNDVIAQNFRNDEAVSLLKSLPQEERTSTTASEEDKALSAAIQDFYSGNLADAEARLRGYRLASPKKPGLGNFYLGATLMTQFYLSSSPDPKLRIEAIRLFKEAADVQGFVAPEKYVSPKIMKVYKEANPGA